MDAESAFHSDIARHIWDVKYRFVGERDVQASWQRIADAIAGAEGDASEVWAPRFAQLLQGFRFLPGGRIQAGAGTSRRVTLFNCFVMGVK